VPFTLRIPVLPRGSEFFPGRAFIIYIAYRVHKDWRDLMGWELGMSLLLILMGGLLLINGLTDLFHL
jgi:hypothetical protein